MCCCISLKILGIIVIVSSVLMLVTFTQIIGGVFVWLGTFLEESGFLDAQGLDYIIIILYCIGAVLMLGGFFGIIGAIKRLSLCLITFSILAFICGILCLVVGGGALYIQSEADNWLGSEADCVDEFEDADVAVHKAASAICTYQCPCDLEAENAYQFAGKAVVLGSAEKITECEPCEVYQTVVPSQQAEILQFMENQLGLDGNDCVNGDISSDDFIDEYFSSDQKKFLPMLGWVEDSFDCAGFCTPIGFYMFSDINGGVPDGSCRGELKDWIEETFMTVGACLVAAAILFLLSPFAACPFYCGCCKNKNGNSSSKM